MAVKRAKYTVAKDEYHFLTDAKAVQILDRKKNLLGTLRELAYEGKTVTSGSFKDLKVTGVYKVKGLADMPDNIPADKECILSVTAVGKMNEPELIVYKLISPTGVIVENTVSGEKESGWGSGGVNLQNTIKDINTAIGDIDKLKTSSKNISDSLNEMYSKQEKRYEEFKDLDRRFEEHNHDNRYVLKAGDTVTGDLSLKNGTAIKVKNNVGEGTNLAHMNKDNVLVMGDPRYDLHIEANNLQLHGSDVLTQANIKDHKVDAATLNGNKDTDFVKTHGDDTKYGDLKFYEGKLTFKLKNGDDYKTGLVFVDDQDKLKSSINGNGVGDIYIETAGSKGSQAPFAFNHDRNFVQYGGSHYIRSAEPGINFQTWDEETGKYDDGIGFFKPKWQKKSLAIGNWMTKEVIGYFGVNNGEAIQLSHSPYIGEQNSRLFIQNAQPTGDVPYGSVWIGF